MVPDVESVMGISSPGPEGQPDLCPVCGGPLTIEPSTPLGDAPCSRCGHLLWFTWEDLGDELLLRPTGDLLDPQSLDRLVESMAMRPGMRLVLDFSKVQSLRSSVLAILIKQKKRAEAVQGTVRLRGLHPDLREVFRICRLDQAFDIEA